MVAIDPVRDRDEPESGEIEQGTLNRVQTRLGPLRARVTTRTKVLDPPHRAVFVSVAPSRPVRIRTEDTLEAVADGCIYRIMVTVTPTVPVIRRLAGWALVRMMVRGRRRFQARLCTVVAEICPPATQRRRSPGSGGTPHRPCQGLPSSRRRRTCRP
jgi:hypothetical protein